MAPGGTNTDSLFVGNRFQGAAKSVCGLFSLLCEGVSCPLEGGQCIVLLQKRMGERKKQSLSWGFAFIWVSLNLKKVRDRDMDCVYPCLHPSFILCPSIPSLPVSGPRGPLAVLCTPGPGFLWLLTTCCRQIVLSVLVHYCTFSCFSQHIKCIKD